LSETTISRAFQILELLEEDRSMITADQAAAELGTTRSTTYRYLKTLCDLGFLAQLNRGGFALGPRIVELERRIQLSDPLLNSARPVMQEHAEDLPGSALLLCSLWGERVLCIHTEVSPAPDGRTIALQRARGMPFPLFKGAASLAILANLPLAKRRSIYLRHGAAIAAEGLGETWSRFRDTTRKIRNAGVSVTTGTFHSNLTAYALPILNETGVAFGSLTRVVHADQANDIGVLTESLRRIVGQICANLDRFVGPARPELTFSQQVGDDAASE